MGTAGALLAAAALTVTATGRVSLTRSAMGTTARIEIATPDTKAALAAAERAMDEIAAVESVLSDYRADSDVTRLRAAAGGPAIAVSPITLAALRASVAFADETRGAFDPTVAPIVRLWRDARRTGKAPSDAATRKIIIRVGWRSIELGDGRARLGKKGMALDLGGIGKGFACDRALALLRDAGFPRAFVSLGGDFAVGDRPPDASGWRIQVEGGPVLPLANCGISTSGASEQYVELGGRRYSHIIDPRSGRPVEGMGFVTVVAGNATASDALATALSVMGPVDGLAFATSRTGTQARIRWRDAAATRTVLTPGFAALTAPEPFRFIEAEGFRTLFRGSTPVWRTITAEPESSTTGFKVYTHLYSPETGARLTGARQQPYPHHRALWVGWQKVTDAKGTSNFWEVPGPSQRFAGFVADREYADAVGAVEVARIEWVAPDGRVVVRELRQLRARPDGPGRTRIDVTSELTAVGSAVTLDGDAHHAGCQLRLSGDARDLAWHRPASATTLGNDVWTGADWTRAEFTLDGSRFTVMHTDDPANPRPVEYSTRPYGRFGSRFQATLLPGAPRTFRWHLAVTEQPPGFQPPPASATLLFDGSGTALWKHLDGSPCRWTVSDSAMTVNGGDIVTAFPIGDCRIRLEFRLPPSPAGATDQARSNSGVYIQERYEIQILDSFGDLPARNGCGAIYQQRAPAVNASRKAGEWQSYEITFRQPRWNPDGTKKAGARISVRHNDILVQDDIEIPNKTGHGKPEGPQELPLKLQDHGHAVSFRNIRIEPLNP